MQTLLTNVNKKLALVVEDSPVQCRVLSVLLEEEGYRVTIANDGARGVEIYINEQPDLVLMDINMPIMNGYEAARKIKSLSQRNSLCPLIFITSMDTDQAYIESIEAGGDGILVRPFSPEVFKAKIKSIQRISDLYTRVKDLQQAQHKDAELAEQLMSEVIESRNYALDKINIIKKPATLFSGDIQLSALSPNGNVNILLGDFTGHGLRSSIGAIPLAETFRTMTKKGFSLLEIITQVNKNLYHLLPTDLFLAACFVSLSRHDQTAYIFNAGLPDTYIFGKSGEIKHKVNSYHPPLGVMTDLLDNIGLKAIKVFSDDHVVLISDGIVEARNELGEMYNFSRFEHAVKKGVTHNNVSQTVLKSVNDFCQGMPQEDDISLIDLPCGDWLETVAINSNASAHSDENNVIDNVISPVWHWRLCLSGERLSKVNAIPLVMNQIQEIEGVGEHWQNLFTVLTELLANALDHGVLALSSDLKNSAEGFSKYYNERERKLKHLTYGFIDIELAYFLIENGGKLNITIKDSGKGFEVKKVLNEDANRVKVINDDNVKLSGRGIKLVEQLCENLTYRKNGTVVEAIYTWTK